MEEKITSGEKQIIGDDIGTTKVRDVSKVAKGPLPSKPRAVLFVPEGGQFDPDMEIAVIGINEEGMQALVARRC